jgi:hypothetical protein
MFQTNLREIDVDMDVNRVAATIKEHGATAWLTSVGGILANYPTDLDFQIRNPLLSSRESGDLIQDSLDSARANDIRLLARMDFSKVQQSVAEAHPEWLYISPNATWQNHTNGLVSVCPSGDWYQERVFDILEEVTSKYELEGFFINWAGYNERDYYRVYHGVCHCDSCKRRWAEYTGDASIELPDGTWSDGYADWKTFSNGVIDEWTARVRDFIAERLPDAALILGESADIMFHESNNAIDRTMWHHATAETVSKHKSHRPDVPVLVNSASFLDHAYRISADESELFIQYFLQAISRGANPSIYIIGIPEKIPWQGLAKAGELVSFHKQWSDVYSGLRPSAKTGLVLPQESQREEEEEYELSSSEYQGLYKTLQELHIPFDVIAQENIEDIADSGGLDRYEVIILPDLGKLLPGDAEALDAWVAAGGKLVATGEVGVDDDGKVQLKSLPASKRVEFTTESEDLWSTYFAPEQNRTEEGYYDGPIIPLLGTYSLYEWKDGSEGRYKKLGFAPFAPPEYIYGNTQVNERGAGIAKFDNGTGILFTFPVGRGYSEIGMSVFRNFFGSIVEEIGTGEVFHVNVAPQVEATVHVNNDSHTVVHLINVSGIRHQSFGSYLPIPAGSIRLHEGVENVIARTLVTNLTLEVVDGEIKLPGIDLFEVVVIQGLD